MFDSQKLLMQTENYILWKHHRQNHRSALLHMDEYKSSNRILLEGYEIDRVKATQDIQNYGKQYYYEQHIAGKYDIKESYRS